MDITKDDFQGLPGDIQTALRNNGTFWPKVVLTDPAMTKIYDAYSYERLKPQNYRKIFRDATRAFKADFDAGLVRAPGAPATADDGAADEADPAPSFEPTDFQKWKSAAGSILEARLIAIDGQGRYVFEDRNGREIPVAPDQLDLESRTRARNAASGG